MIPRVGVCDDPPFRIPRESGDDPWVQGDHALVREYSPRERG